MLTSYIWNLGVGLKRIWFIDKKEFPDLSVIIDILRLLRNYLPNYSSIQKFFESKQIPRSGNEKRPVGLRNIGLNCYLNSSFQSIVACTKFVEEMKLLELRYPASKTLRVFNKILFSLSTNCDGDVELSGNEIFRMWNKSGEQDTFELLSYVIFQVFNELRKINQEKMRPEEQTVNNWNKEPLPLKLLIEFNIRCRCGYNFSPSLQSDLALHLPVPFRIYSDNRLFTIENLLDSYFRPEKITDFPCANESCTNKEITKLIILQKPMPNTLCIHVQRSFWNSATGRMEKNNEKINFGEKLVLKNDFFSANRSSNEEGPILKRILEEFQGDLLRANEGKEESVHLINFEINGDDKKISRGGDTNNIIDFPTPGSVCQSISKDVGLSIQNEDGRSVKLEPSLTSQAAKIDETLQIIPVDSSILDVITTDKINNNNEEDDTSKSVSLDETATKELGSCKIKTREVECIGFNENYVQANDEFSQIEQSNLDKKEEYYLKSVIVHFGRAESGHYICYGKCGDRWFCTNDDFITEVSFAEVQNSQAYILMYEKID